MEDELRQAKEAAAKAEADLLSVRNKLHSAIRKGKAIDSERVNLEKENESLKIKLAEAEAKLLEEPSGGEADESKLAEQLLEEVAIKTKLQQTVLSLQAEVETLREQRKTALKQLQTESGAREESSKALEEALASRELQVHLGCLGYAWGAYTVCQSFPTGMYRP